MTSQNSIQSSFGGSLTLPLSKFSHATVSEDNGTPIPWVHLASRGDLFAVFEDGPSMVSSQGPPDQKLFRVVNGADLMEELNLAALAAEARKAKAQFSDSSIASRVNAVTIIIKAPCIAVRYPRGQRQIQRFQMRFSSNFDYYTALGRFSAVNAPLTEAGSILPQPRPVSVSSSSSLLKPSNSISNVDLQRPSTAMDSLDQGHGISFGHLAHPEVSTAAHRSTSSDMRRTETYLDQPVLPVTEKIPLEPPHNMRNVSPPVVSARSGTSLPKSFGVSKHIDGGTITSIGPTNSFEARTTTLATSNVLTTLTDSHVGTAFSNHHPRPSTAPAVESQSLRDMLPPRRVLPFSKSSSETGSKTLSKQKSTAKPTFQSAVTVGASSIPGTSSFQVELANSQNLETQCAPSSNPKPKKDVTKKLAARAPRNPATPKSKKKPTAPTAQSPVPSVEDLLSRSQKPANEVPPAARDIDTQALLAQVEGRQAFGTTSTSPKKRGLPAGFHVEDPWIPPSAQRPAPYSLRSRSDRTPQGLGQVQQKEQPSIEARVAPAEDSAEHRTRFEDPTIPSTNARNVPARVSKLKMGPQPETQRRDTQPLGLSDSRAIPSSSVPASATATRAALAERSINAPTYSSLSAPEMSTSQHTASPSKLVGPIDALLQDENFAPTPDLAKWARQTEEDRRASLETFICENLESESFFTLCEDLSGMWQTRFLGKKI